MTDSHFVVELWVRTDSHPPHLRSPRLRALAALPGTRCAFAGDWELPGPLELTAWSASVGSLTDP